MTEAMIAEVKEAQQHVRLSHIIELLMDIRELLEIHVLLQANAEELENE